MRAPPLYTTDGGGVNERMKRCDREWLLPLSDIMSIALSKLEGTDTGHSAGKMERTRPKRQRDQVHTRGWALEKISLQKAISERRCFLGDWRLLISSLS